MSREYAQERADAFNAETKTKNASVRKIANAFPQNPAYGFPDTSGYIVVFKGGRRVKMSDLPPKLRSPNPLPQKSVYNVSYVSRKGTFETFRTYALTTARELAAMLKDTLGVKVSIQRETLRSENPGPKLRGSHSRGPVKARAGSQFKPAKFSNKSKLLVVKGFHSQVPKNYRGGMPGEYLVRLKGVAGEKHEQYITPHLQSAKHVAQSFADKTGKQVEIIKL